MPIFLDPNRPGPRGPTEVVRDDAWPEDHWVARPGDEIGAAIIAYRDQWMEHPDFPPSPWDDRTGRINLVPPDVVRPATDDVPRYRVRVAAAFVGANLYTAGQEVPYPSWPDHPHQLEAANPSAQLVLDYMNRYAAGQKLAGLVHKSGRLHFPNPALRGSPISPTLRWAGAAAAR